LKGVAMPTTIAEAFEAAGIIRNGVVRWGTKPTTSKPGVYIISLTEALDDCNGKLTDAQLPAEGFEGWLKRCPELTLDGGPPTVPHLKDRIRSFWIPDEVILYIGLAGTPLSKRLGQYYGTQIGARKPHSGGYFLKLLSNPDRLWVHFAQHPDPGLAEHRMLRRFCDHVSADSRGALRDPVHPFPFANLEWPCGTRKAHGIGGAREPKGKASSW
jgi:hypothetical protein